METFLHYSLHFLFPLIVAFLFFRKNWKMTYLILMATMLVDLDHLLATPIFKADRCSIGFHYLHTYPAIAFYFFLLFFRKPFYIVGLGLLLHMCTDLLDCLFMYDRCKPCFSDAPAVGILKFISMYLK